MQSSTTNNSFSKHCEQEEFNGLNDDEKREILHDMYGRNTITVNANDTKNVVMSSSSNNEITSGIIISNIIIDSDGSDRSSTTTTNKTQHSNSNNITTINSKSTKDIVVKNEEQGSCDSHEQATTQFYAALDRIPVEKSAYLFRALVVDEFLVDEESDFWGFCQHENNCYDKGALRMCDYWETRGQIFGDVKAYKPMDLFGAMHDFDLFRYVIKLPNLCRILPNDDYGRTVVCIDFTGLSFKDYSDLVLLKVIWFVVHKASLKSSTFYNGVVVLIIDPRNNFDFPSANLMKMMIKILFYCTPITIRCVHLCLSSLVGTAVLPTFKHLAPRHARLRSQLHNSIHQPKKLKELESFGLQRKNLPKSIGGKYNKNPVWVEDCGWMLKCREGPKYNNLQEPQHKKPRYG